MLFIALAAVSIAIVLILSAVIFFPLANEKSAPTIWALKEGEFPRWNVTGTNGTTAVNGSLIYDMEPSGGSEMIPVGQYLLHDNNRFWDVYTGSGNGMLMGGPLWIDTHYGQKAVKREVFMTNRAVTIDYVGIESLLDYRMMVYGENFTLDMELNNTNHPGMSGLDNSIGGPLESYASSPNGEGGASFAPGLQGWNYINMPNGGELSGTFLDGAGGSLFVLSLDSVSQMESSGQLHYNVSLSSDAQPRTYSNIHLDPGSYLYALNGDGMENDSGYFHYDLKLN